MSFLGLDFFGDDARGDLQQGRDAAAHLRNAGKDEAIGTLTDYTDRSLARIDPYEQAGQGALGLYNDYLGVNGQDARQGFFDDYQAGPEFEAANQYGVRALDRSAAARGSLFSGGQMENLYDFGMTNFGNFLNPYLDRLQGSSNQGFQAASLGSGILSDTGRNIADIQYGNAQLGANDQIGYGNASAGLRGTAMNNILGIGNVVASAYGAS